MDLLNPRLALISTALLPQLSLQHIGHNTTLHLHRPLLILTGYYTMYRKLAYSTGMVALMAGMFTFAKYSSCKATPSIAY